MMGHPESLERSHPRYTTSLIDERMTIPSRTDKLDWAWRTGVTDHLHTFNGHLPSLDLQSKEELDVRHHWPAAIDLQQRRNRNADFRRCQTQDILIDCHPFWWANCELHRKTGFGEATRDFWKKKNWILIRGITSIKTLTPSYLKSSKSTRAHDKVHLS